MSTKLKLYRITLMQNNFRYRATMINGTKIYYIFVQNFAIGMALSRCN